METIIRKIFFIFISINLYSQNTDTLKVSINLNKYTEIATVNLKERYLYTNGNLDSLKNIFDYKESDLLTFYQLDSLYTMSIPLFTIKANAKISSKENFASHINFENNFTKQYFNIYNKENLLMNTNILDKSRGIIDYSLIKCSYTNPIYFGSLHGFMIKLMLEKKYFVFMISGFGDVLFIHENNMIYAIYNPDNNGNYEKKELNEFFGNIIGVKKLKRILKGYTYLPHEIKKNRKVKFFKEQYKVLFKIK